MREKMSREARAKQFMPFAALKGYEDLVSERNKIMEEKKELTEEESAELDRLINAIKKGDIVSVCYFDRGEYVKTVGAVTFIDKAYKKIRVIKTEVEFDKILKIEIIS